MVGFGRARLFDRLKLRRYLVCLPKQLPCRALPYKRKIIADEKTFLTCEGYLKIFSRRHVQ